MADSQLRDRYLLTLMERVREDPYPSSAHMDLIESLMPVDDMDTYLEILMEKIEGERYPSIAMLERIQRLSAQLPQAG